MNTFSEVQLDAPAVETPGDVVIRSGKTFEIGVWPDKGFSLTEEEADDAIAHFTPAPINHEHGPSVFDGLLGHVQRIWRQGKEIFAEYAIPKELHSLFKGKPIKVSNEWTTDEWGKKRMKGCALVLNPRIRDAVMMTAFSMSEDETQKAQILEAMVANFSTHVDKSEFGRPKKEKPSTGHGKGAIQEAHDHAARHGAICADGDASMSADFTMKHEQKGLQAIHDAACMAGATCPNPNGFYYSADSAPLPIKDQNMNEDEKKTSLWDKMRAFFKSEGIEVPDEDAKPVATATPGEMKPIDVTATAEFKAKEQEVERMQAELEEARISLANFHEAKEAQFKADNEKAIDAYIEAGKINFAERESELVKRTKSPELYDDFMGKQQSQFSGKRTPTPGTEDASTLLRNAEANLPERAQFNSTVASARDITGLSL